MTVEELLSEHLAMKCSLIGEYSGRTTRDTLAAIERAFTIAADLGVSLALTPDLVERIDLLDDVVDEDDPGEIESLRYIMSVFGLTSKWSPDYVW